MFTWTPPRGTKVVFGIEGGTATRESEVFCANLLEPFGIKYNRIGHLSLRVDDPRWPKLLEAIESAERGNRLVLKACWLEEPAPKASDPNAWFELAMGTVEFRSAARAPKGAHLMYRGLAMLASERFLEAVSAAGLTGLASLPLADSRPDDPMTWHEVYATHPIGRGLDHPLLDPARHEAELAADEVPASRRAGEPVAWRRLFRTDLEAAGEIVERVLKLGDEEYARVEGPRRFVREHLPTADFAYLDWDLHGDDGPGAEGRPRRIGCNSKARQALIDAGVLKAADFDPLATVPAEEAISVILDRTVPGPVPPPAYTPEEGEVERARRLEAQKAGARSSRPKRAVFKTLDQAITALEKRLADGTASWTAAGGSDEFEQIRSCKLFKKTPKAWQRIAHLLPLEGGGPGESEGEPDLDFVLVEPMWNDVVEEDDDREAEEKPSTDDLILAETPYGDWYAVRKGDPLLPDDARVVHWDHETMCITDEWPSVAAFVSAIIAACDRDAEA